MKKIAVISDIVCIDQYTQSFLDGIGQIEKFSIRDDLSKLFLDSYFDLVILITCNRSIKLEDDLQRQCRNNAARFIRLYVGQSVAFLGPMVYPDLEGCLKCTTISEQNNHPHRSQWTELFVDESLPVFERIYGWHQSGLAILFTALNDAISNNLLNNGIDSHVMVFEEGGILVSLHKVVAHPNCPICSKIELDTESAAKIELGKYRPQAKGGYRIANSKLTTKNLKKLFHDRRFGLVKHIYQDVFSTYMPMCGAEVPIRGSETIETGFGRSLTSGDSEKVAILESLERFVGHAPRRVKTAVRGSYEQLKDKALNPKLLTLHEDCQRSEPGFNFIPYSDELEYNWVWGHSLKHNRGVLVPEQCVYYRLESIPHRHPLNRFVYESSNGCALGGSDEEATFYGLLEVIERDSYLSAFYARAPLTELSLDDVKDINIRLLTERVKALGYDLYVYDMTMETGVPTIWAMIANPSDDALVKTYCAAGCHPDPEKAILGALAEVITSIAVYEVSMPEDLSRARELVKDFSKVQTMHDHVLLYSQEEALEWLSFLKVGNKKTSLREQYSSWYQDPSFSNMSDELEKLLAKISTISEDIIVIKQDYPAMQSVGISCVKVLVVGMLTIFFGQQHRRINLDRISAVANFRHLINGPMTRDQLNPYPHNFP